MGLPAEHPDRRFPDAQAPCSGTGEATRPFSFFDRSLLDKEQQQSCPARDDRSRIVTQPPATSLTLSYPASPIKRPISRSPVFDTALYDPSSDSIHIMPHTNQTSLDSQLRDFKDKINNVKPYRSIYSYSERPQSISLPLRDHDTTQDTTNDQTRGKSLPARTSLCKFGHISGKSFE